MAEQIPLSLRHRVALDRDVFIVAANNSAAVRAIDSWPQWPGNALLLTGPRACGKSHLANVWVERTGAQRMDADKLGEATDASSAMLVEDIQTIAGSVKDETQLFHLINRIRERKGSLLLTSTGFPRDWPVRLPDLASRLQGMYTTTILAPNDEMLTELVAKQFADRGIRPDPNLIAYILARSGRSFAAIADAVERLDHSSLATGGKMTRKIVRDVLSGGEEKPAAPVLKMPRKPGKKTQ